MMSLFKAPAGIAPASADHDDLRWFFTSDTTRRPKAAVLTHGRIAFVATNHLSSTPIHDSSFAPSAPSCATLTLDEQANPDSTTGADPYVGLWRCAQRWRAPDEGRSR
jgi:acyl-CoA synthetase (AMP-forming)/AMP-acid ligase II